MSVFSTRLKLLRTSRKITQKQVAFDIKISERGYQYYELDKKEPTLGVIINLCNYFKVSADYLLGLSDDPTRH